MYPLGQFPLHPQAGGTQRRPLRRVSWTRSYTPVRGMGAPVTRVESFRCQIIESPQCLPTFTLHDGLYY